MNENNSYDLLVGVAVSILTGWLSTCDWPGWAKQVTALVLSILLAAARCYLTGDLTGVKLSVAVALVAATAYGSYKTITKDIAEKAQAVGPVKSTVTEVKEA
jgi:hypothetical protein